MQSEAIPYRGRRWTLEAFVSNFAAARGSQYKVVRGFADCASWGGYTKDKPGLVTIEVDPLGIDIEAPNFFRELNLSIQIARKVHEIEPTEEGDRGFVDAELEGMLIDIEETLGRISQAMVQVRQDLDAAGQPVVLRVVPGATATEFATIDWMVQGFDVRCKVEY